MHILTILFSSTACFSFHLTFWFLENCIDGLGLIVKEFTENVSDRVEALVKKKCSCKYDYRNCYEYMLSTLVCLYLSCYII